jgi:hypothetical protein
LKNYIAAGFDPARFWDITPRLFMTEMEGAAMRSENRRAEIWMTAMLPHMDKPIQFQEFVTGEKDKRAEILKCISAWDKIDRALARVR